ncbi:MAG: methylated-DNA--[protein]-cysteine S-methyltransferase [Anaerolineae bacterium]|nr:MAG: methylated-DNA--[protein]-cysteine S-methyltransferase [Anaerolineae bacterium]
MIRYGQMPDTPLGRLWIAKSDKGVVALEFQEDVEELTQSLESIFKQKPILSQDAIREEAAQLDRYFQGKQINLDLKVDWTRFREFQHDVLLAVFNIPPGQTKTYGQIAKEIGRTNNSARAVGRAVATNPISIIIPCHRVVGVNGELTGYGGPGGIKTKAWLLSLEGFEFGQQLQFPL